MELTEVALVHFEDACVHLASLYMDLKIRDIDDISGFKAVHSARMVVKGKRVEVEKRRKELKEEALSYGRMVDGEAKRIFGLLEPIEKYLEDEEKAYILLKEKKRLEAEEAEQRRIQSRFDALLSLGMVLPWSEIQAMTPEVFGAKLEEAKKAVEVEKERQAEAAREQAKIEAENARLAAKQATELARIEAEKKAAMEVERARLAEIAKEQARIAAELRIEKARLEEIAREQARIEAERRAALDADEKARIAAEQAVVLPLTVIQSIEQRADQAKIKAEEIVALEACLPVGEGEEVKGVELTTATLRLFNASGHPIIQDGIHVVGSVEVPNVDLADPKAVFSLSMDIAKAARKACENATPIALPGMTILAAQVLAMLQGLTGQLPIIAWAARTDGKFVWDRKQMIDLHAMRVLMREER